MCPPTRSGRRPLLIGCALICLAGCAWETSVAASEHLMKARTSAAYLKATRLAPLNGDLWRWLGVLSLDADPLAAKEYLTRAAALNPFDSNAFIGLGLLAENRPDLEEAQKRLLQAVSVSNRFQPKWALAFFYARTGRLDHFWPAAAVAANVPSADVKPVFQLALSLRGDPRQVAALLQLESQSARAAYLGFLLSRPGAEGVSAIALGIHPAPQTAHLLIEACERLIEAKRSAEAVQVWNTIARTRLSPHQGISLTNPHFEGSGLQGFDWRAPATPGVTFTPRPEGMRLEFSGRQPENFRVLEHFVPVLEDRNYKLAFVYRTAELNGPTGLAWHISPQGASEITARAIDRLPYGSAVVEFRTSSDMLHLALRYRRPTGATRLEGIVTLVSMDLKLL